MGIGCERRGAVGVVPRGAGRHAERHGTGLVVAHPRDEPGDLDRPVRVEDRERLHRGRHLGPRLGRRGDTRFLEQVGVVVEAVRVRGERHRALHAPVLRELDGGRRELRHVDAVGVDLRLEILPRARRAEVRDVVHVGRDGDVGRRPARHRRLDLRVVDATGDVDRDPRLQLVQPIEHRLELLELAAAPVRPKRDGHRLGRRRGGPGGAGARGRGVVTAGRARDAQHRDDDHREHDLVPHRRSTSSVGFGVRSAECTCAGAAYLRRAKRDSSATAMPAPAPTATASGELTRTRPPSSTVTFGETTTPTNAARPDRGSARRDDHLRTAVLDGDVAVGHQRPAPAVADRHAPVREHRSGATVQDREVAVGGDEAGRRAGEMHVAGLHEPDDRPRHVRVGWELDGGSGSLTSIVHADLLCRSTHPKRRARLEARRRARWDRASCRHRTRDPAGHRRAAARRRSDLEHAADRLDAVGHAAQAGPVARPLHVEPRAVVGHLEREVAVGLREPDLGAAPPPSTSPRC